MSEPHKCRIAIVDDHKAFTDGLRAVLKRIDFVHLVGIYHRVEEYLPAIKSKKPDIVLMDINIKYSFMDGVQATTETLRQNPNIKIIALSMHDDGSTVKKMIDAGACAYFTKDLSLKTLKEVLEKVCNGETFIAPKAAQNYTKESMHKDKQDVLVKRDDFTVHELEVMDLASSGKTDKEIAKLMDITPKIVEYEKVKIYRKLNVHNAAEMVRVAFRLGLLK